MQLSFHDVFFSSIQKRSDGQFNQGWFVGEGVGDVKLALTARLKG